MKKTTENFRALTLRQEAILEAVPDIIAEVDNNKVYTWLNKPGLEFFGDDAVGKEAACYFEGQQDTYAAVQPLFNGNPDIIYLESWQRRKDGRKRLLAWWCRVLKNADGAVTGALSTARDITEQKRAEETLRESEEKYRNIVEQFSEGLTLTDEQGLIIEWNKACERMTGLPRETVLGKPCWDVLIGSTLPERRTPENRVRLEGMVREILRGGHLPILDNPIEVPSSATHRYAVKNGRASRQRSDFAHGR